MAATATFGRDFGNTNSSGFGLNGEPVKVVLPSVAERSGCSKMTKPSASEFVFLLDRGGCMFSDKLLHAAQAGAAGVVLFEKTDPLNPEIAALPEGTLIRPSAEDCSADVLTTVKDIGMIFTSSQVGEIVKKTIEVEGQDVEIEIKPLENGMKDTLGADKTKEKAGKGREGRMALGEWEIWNLRIVEAI